MVRSCPRHGTKRDSNLAAEHLELTYLFGKVMKASELELFGGGYRQLFCRFSQISVVGTGNLGRAQLSPNAVAEAGEVVAGVDPCLLPRLPFATKRSMTHPVRKANRMHLAGH